MTAKKRLIGLAAVLALLLIGGAAAVYAAGGPLATPPADATPQSPERTIEGRDGGPAGESPTISFIDSPSPGCYRPAAATGACLIRFPQLTVAATSPAYIISMTVAIDGRLVAYHSGFFQTSMTVPARLDGDGFQVVCGRPGDTPSQPTMGRSYAYTIRARETGGLKSANYGSVVCPADEISVYAPLVRRR